MDTRRHTSRIGAAEPDVIPMDCEFTVPPPLENEIEVSKYITIKEPEPDVIPMDCEFTVPPPLENEIEVSKYITIR